MSIKKPDPYGVEGGAKPKAPDQKQPEADPTPEAAPKAATRFSSDVVAGVVYQPITDETCKARLSSSASRSRKMVRLT